MNEKTDKNEMVLFRIFAEAVLETGAGVGFRGKKWMGMEGKFTALEEEEGKAKRTEWGTSMDAVEDVILKVLRERKKLDDVYFFFTDEKGQEEGVTWRMVKIDMSYLRIVLAHSKSALQEIIQRMIQVSIMTQFEDPNAKDRFSKFLS